MGDGVCYLRIFARHGIAMALVGFYVRIPILLHTYLHEWHESHVGGTYVHSAGHAYLLVINGVWSSFVYVLSSAGGLG